MKQVVVINLNDPEVRRSAQMKIWRHFVLERLVVILKKIDDVAVFLGIELGEFVKLNPGLQKRLKQAKVEIFDPFGSLEDAERVRSLPGNLVCPSLFLRHWIETDLPLEKYAMKSPYIFCFCIDLESIREAKRLLFKDSKKDTDGWVSKRINALISIPISRFLSRFSMHPNWITLLNIPFALLGPWLFVKETYLSGAIAGMIFQLGSILDGCDGEIARVKLQVSKFGGWFDTTVDNLSYLLFFFAVGIRQAERTGSRVYFNVMLGGLISLFISLLVTYVGMKRMGSQTHHAYRQALLRHIGGSRISKLISRISVMSKRENFALGIMFLCLLGLRGVIYWILLVGLFLYSAVVLGTFPKLYRKIREGVYA